MPQNNTDLNNVVDDKIADHGENADLNIINTSAAMNMSEVFKNTTFNGDVSFWDVSNVAIMFDMFYGATAFNDDISNWEVG